MNTSRSAFKDPGDQPPPRARLILHKISESRYRISDLGWVVCRLWRLDNPPESQRPSGYAVELRGLGSRRFRLIGGDVLRARRIFALLVRHTVTPCGLCDVLEELD